MVSNTAVSPSTLSRASRSVGPAAGTRDGLATAPSSTPSARSFADFDHIDGKRGVDALAEGFKATGMHAGSTAQDPPDALAAHDGPAPPSVYYIDGIPRALLNRKLYVVTSGYRTGIFSDWLLTSQLVNGFSGNAHKSFKNSKAPQAFKYWARVCLSGALNGAISSCSLVGRVLPGANPTPPPASAKESSIER